MKLIMPMAGEGSRFQQVGYTDPKPFIPVNGKPMFQHVVENIGLEFDELIFIVQKKHNIKERVLKIYPEAKVVEITELTEGAACTILAAREHYEDGSSIFIANCDQHVEWHPDIDRIHDRADGSIALFHCPDRSPKWSYAELDGVHVKRVAEKNPISDWATVGFYSWKDGREFISAAEEMIAANDRVNNEFYLCPVFNYSIAHGKDIVGYTVAEMHGIGTPEDFEAWQQKTVDK